MPPLNILLAPCAIVKIGPECSLIVPMQDIFYKLAMFHSFIVQSYDPEINMSLSLIKAKSRTAS